MSAPKTSTRPRRTRRGEQTRQALITGTITCLQRAGYAQTTVEQVMAETGFSRGSVLHQFPTRLDMIQTAIEAAMQDTIEDTRARFAAIDDPATAYRAACDVFWGSFQLPQAAAITEALLAARWDAELASALRPVGARAEVEIDRMISTLASAAGASDLDSCLIQSRFLIVSLRGMTLELAYSPEREIMRQALARIRSQHADHCNSVLGVS